VLSSRGQPPERPLISNIYPLWCSLVISKLAAGSVRK
jgi:hypothetical protein